MTEIADSGEPFTCPRCGARSFNRTDIAEGYCGSCHDWTGDKSDD